MSLVSKTRRLVLAGVFVIGAAIMAPDQANAGWGVGWGYVAPPVVAYRPVVRPVVRPVATVGYVARRAVAPVVAYRPVVPVPAPVYRPVVPVPAPVVPVPAVPYSSSRYYSGYGGYGVSVSVGYGVSPVGYYGYGY